MKISISGRFEQSSGIGSVGLAASYIGAYILRRQQSHLHAARIEIACPVVGRAARFHDDTLNRAVGEEALELSTGQAMLLDHAVLDIFAAEGTESHDTTSLETFAAQSGWLPHGKPGALAFESIWHEVRGIAGDVVRYTRGARQPALTVSLP